MKKQPNTVNDKKLPPRFMCPECGFSMPTPQYNIAPKQKYCPICEVKRLDEFLPEW